MKIIVTKADIDKAISERDKVVPDSGQACPIYEAVYRKLKGKVIGVSRKYIWLKSEKSYLLPQVAIDFTLDFDNKKEVKPFEFEVNYA